MCMLSLLATIFLRVSEGDIGVGRFILLEKFCGLSWRRMSDFFFFQAEDGIRDLTVTGVQTCVLPIWGTSTCCGEVPRRSWLASPMPSTSPSGDRRGTTPVLPRRRRSSSGPASARRSARSGERRVGEECRSRWAPYHLKKKKTCSVVQE